jgi:4a-hydroxytetrahydrobiopterin dehydratase
LEADLARLQGWSRVRQDGRDAIEKTWRFADFRRAMAFANAVAELAERLDHHPDLQVGWGRCAVLWTSHDAGGLTARDVRAAREVDALPATWPSA